MFIRLTTALYQSQYSIPKLATALLLLGSALMTPALPASAQTELSDIETAQDTEVIQLGSTQSFSDDYEDWETETSSELYSPVRMSLHELKARIRQHPTLETFTYSAAADRSRAESALSLPDPVVSLGLNNVPLFDPSFSEYLPSNKAVGVRQDLPSRSARKAASLKSLRLADQSDLGSEERYARIEGRVFALVISRDYLIQQRDLIQQRIGKYDELTDIIDIEISAGRPLLYRLAQIDIERADAERELTNIDQDIRVSDAELINWVGVVPDLDLPELRLTPLTGNAMQFHGVRVADARVEVSDADVQKAEADFKPNWGVNLTYQQRESGQGPRSNFDGEDWVSGGVTFTVPLWSGKRQTPNLQAAKSDRQAALSSRTARARELRTEWMQYEAKRDAASKNIKMLERKILAIKEQSDAQLIQYESGSGDFSPILDAEIATLTLETEILKEASRRDQMVVMMNSLLVTP